MSMMKDIFVAYKKTKHSNNTVKLFKL